LPIFTLVRERPEITCLWLAKRYLSPWKLQSPTSSNLGVGAAARA